MSLVSTRNRDLQTKFDEHDPAIGCATGAAAVRPPPSPVTEKEMLMNRFLVSTALALVLAAPAAFAQNGNASGNAAPAQQQGQPQSGRSQASGQHQTPGVPGQIRITSAGSLAGRSVFDDSGKQI